MPWIKSQGYNNMNVQATSQASAEDMEKLTEKAKEMGANTSKSASDAAEGLNYMALAGWKTEEMLAGIEPILKASVAYNADLGTTSDLATDSLSALGLTAQDLGKYMDIVSNAQSNANTTGTDLMQAYIEVGGTFKNLNTSLEESSTLLGVMANRGIKSSEAGNALNSILINLTKKSGESADAMEALGISAFDSEGNFRGITAVLRDVNEKLSGMTEEQQTNYKSMIAGKNQITAFNALLAGLGEEYDTLYSKQSNCTGALEKMYKTMSNNTQGKIDEFKSKLEALGIELSDKLLPHINKLLDKFMDLVDWFGNLSDSTQESILKFGFYTFGAGAALKVTGKFASGIGSLVSAGGNLIKFLGTNTKVLGSLGTKLTATTTATGALKIGLGALSKAYAPLAVVVAGAGAAVYAFNEHQKAMNRTGLKSREEMSFLERAFVDLSGGVSYTRKELEEMGLVQKELSSNMSDEFKTSVNNARTEVQEFAFDLKQVNLDDTITSEECNSLVDRVNNMCEQALKVIEENNAEIKKVLGEGFNLDNNIDTYEQNIINYYERAGNKNKEEVQRMQEEINEIMRKVRDEGYTLTPADEQMIIDYATRIKELELQAQADAQNKWEQEYSKQEFKSNVKNADAQEYSKILQEKRKAYDKDIEDTNNYYNTLIAQTREGYNEMDYATQKSVDATVFKLEQERKQKIDIANQGWNETLTIAEQGNSNLFSILDEQSGRLLEGQELDNKRTLDNMRERYRGINEINESGMYELYNKSTESWDKVYVNVDENTGKVVGCVQYMEDEYGMYANEMGFCNNKVKNSTADMASKAQDDYNRLTNALKTSEAITVNSNGKMVTSNGKVVGSLKDIKTNADGTKTGIINLNGTPVKVNVNKDGTISNLDEIKRNINSIPTEKNVRVNVIYNGSGTYSDGRGNVWVGGNKVMGSGYATGTTNATRGVHLVGEQGPELVYFSGGETVLNALKTRNILTAGGYFDKGSYESRQLINNYNNSSRNTTINNTMDITKLVFEMGKMMNDVVSAIGGLSIKMNTKEVAKMIDKENGTTNAKNRRLRGC